jgi:hypothetical protein
MVQRTNEYMKANLDNIKQPAAILVLPESSSICNTGTDTGKY